MKKVLFYIFFVTASNISLYAQDIRVNAGFDTTRILIGDQVGFKLTIEQPADLALSIPEFRDTIIKNIEILKGPAIDSVRDINGKIRIRKEYLVTSFDSGVYQVPPVYVELRSDDGLKRFYSDYSYLEVLRPDVTPADSTAQIFDIVGPYRAPVSLGEILPWILLVMILTVAGYFAYSLYKKYRKHKPGIEVITIKVPAHTIAFRELEKLREEKLWQKGEIKEYYSRLSEILRQYLENRFTVFSLELTTSETLEKLLKTGFKKDSHYEKLKSVLTGADMVKFAKYNPEPTENEGFFEDSWNFIAVTKIEETVKEEAEEIKSRVGGEV